MSKSRTPRTHTRNQKKRHGRHHKQSPDYIKTYLPYLPLVVSLIASVFFSFWHPASKSTLAYATSMSVSGLLSATNAQRSGNGKAALSLNAKLNSSAQAKANDMVAKNYWAHTTPSGQEPWVFFDGAGYSYVKAGENLAYGFATSADAVTGWMNSSTHKANMLDVTFTEVGFGFANGPNYNGDGQQTVVVAHYAKPQTLAATQAQPAPATPTPQAVPTAPATSAPVPIAQKPRAKADPKAAAQPKNPLPITTEQPVAAAMPTSQNIAAVETLTGGRAPWLAALVASITSFAIIAMLIHHSLKARHLLHDLIHGTERFVLHHPLLDSTLLGLTILGTVLSRTVGTVL